MRPQGAYFEGDRAVIVLCTVLLVSSSINVSIFPSPWLDTLWTGHFLFISHTHTHTHTHTVQQDYKKYLLLDSV